MQIPEAKLDNIKDSEPFVKPFVFSVVSKVWLEELIKYRQDLIIEHDISKLFLFFLKKSSYAFKKKLLKAWRTSLEELSSAIS